MKKFVMGMAPLLIAGFSFDASAQNDKKAECQNPHSVCIQNCDGNKHCYGHKNNKDRKKNHNGLKRSGISPFADLNLTDSQKAQIENLNRAMANSKKELRDQAKTAREKKDTTFNPRKSMTDLRGKYLNDLSKILTPAQYNDFLKNYYINNGSHRHGHDKFAKGKRHVRKNFAQGKDTRRDGNGKGFDKRNSEKI